MKLGIEDMYPCLSDFDNEKIRNTKGEMKIIFSFKTQFRFGRYSTPKDINYRSRVKGSLLADVWKFDAEYVKWLILNADGFAILPITLDLLLTTPIFNNEDLREHILIEEESNVYYLDLKGFYLEGNFKFHKNVREISFDISSFEREKLIQFNLQKIENNILDCAAACKGSMNWSINTPIGLKPKKHIIIRR